MLGRVRDRLPPRRFADEHVALIGERDHARREPIAFGIGNDLRFFTFHYGDDRVGGAQVDANDFFPSGHDVMLLLIPLNPDLLFISNVFAV